MRTKATSDQAVIMGENAFLTIEIKLKTESLFCMSAPQDRLVFIVGCPGMKTGGSTSLPGPATVFPGKWPFSTECKTKPVRC